MTQAQPERGEFAIRISFLTRPVTRVQAERMARSIQRHAEGLAKISHAYNVEIATEGDDMRADET